MASSSAQPTAAPQFIEVEYQNIPSAKHPKYIKHEAIEIGGKTLALELDFRQLATYWSSAGYIDWRNRLLAELPRAKTMIDKVLISVSYDSENFNGSMDTPAKKAQRALIREIVRILNSWAYCITSIDVWLKCVRLQNNQVHVLSLFRGLDFRAWTCNLKAKHNDTVVVDWNDKRDPWKLKLIGWYHDYRRED